MACHRQDLTIANLDLYARVYFIVFFCLAARSLVVLAGTEIGIALCGAAAPGGSRGYGRGRQRATHKFAQDREEVQEDRRVSTWLYSSPPFSLGLGMGMAFVFCLWLLPLNRLAIQARSCELF